MDYKGFLKELKARTEYDFCDYSDSSISRRLNKICEDNKMTFEELLDKVIADEVFLGHFVEEVTVNTTELFRDPEVWIALYKTMYKSLPKSTVTFWHVGCSVGLETYSNLILLKELGILDRCRVIGTDLNPRVLFVARKGEYVYQFNIHYVENFNAVMKGIGSNSKFEEYFDIDKEQDIMKVKKDILEVPKFLRQNLVQDKPPFAYKADVVFIRNVMIYFNDMLQRKIMTMINDKLYKTGYLVFGKRESVPMSMKNRFEQSGIYYQKIN